MALASEAGFDDFLNLARLALSGRTQDVQAYLQRTARRYQRTAPENADRLVSLLRENPNRASPLRRDTGVPLPVDFDSRQQLVRIEHPTAPEVTPILADSVRARLEQVVAEHTKSDQLAKAGLSPTRSVLFVGEPGVGKTLSGRWIASRLNKTLLILDLSAVMSSLLGKTGSNVRAVIDYAKSSDCILFMDEIDAVAKRRDDDSEIGELKRLVTVILQEIDDWPSGSLLLAATNHPDLLDPAVWRRFDVTLDFPKPTKSQILQALEVFLGPDFEGSHDWVVPLLHVFQHRSLNDVERALLRARRQKVINSSDIATELETVFTEFASSLDGKERRALAAELQASKRLSDHKIHDLTGVSRVTLKKLRSTTSES